MKKLLLSILCALFCLFGMAQTEKTYHDQCTVIADDEAQEPDDIDVTIVDNGDGTINITLLNFIIRTAYGDVDPIDFVFENVPVVEGEDGYDHVNDYKGTFTIPSSKLPGILKLAASSFENIPYTLNGKRNDEKMFATINIEISISVFMVLNKDVSVLVDIKPKKVYTEQLIVTVNGQGPEPQSTDVSVTTNDDETINFELKNFVLTIDGEPMPVGNIVLDSLSVTKGEDGLQYFSYNGSITIAPGDLEEYDEWAGPYLDEVPLVLQGKMNDEKLFVTIDIDMQQTIGQIIYVQLGTDDFDTPTPPTPVEGKVYTEQLVVTINGNSTEPQETDVTVYDNEDGTINFELKNLVLTIDGEPMPVGNIVLNNLSVEQGNDGLDYFSYNGSITIAPGDLEEYDEWAGPYLDEVPLVLQGKMNDEKLFVTIDIDMQQTIGQIIYVQLGTDDFFDIPEGKVYTDQYVITFNGETSEPQETDVTVIDNEDGTIKFVLKDFVITMGDNVIPVGDISLDNVAVEEGEDGLRHFYQEGTFDIPADKAGNFAQWAEMGYLNNIPYKLDGKMNDEKLFATIDINVELLGQILIQFGTDFIEKIAGDVNGDGKVDVADAQFVLILVADQIYDENADVNKDNVVDVADVQSILIMIADQQ